MMPKRSSPVEDLLTAAARLPPAVTIALALASYFLCRFVAAWAPPLPDDTHGLTVFAPEHYVITISAVLQYALPVLLVFAAVASYLRRKTQRPPRV
jgi:hypothetical protein